MDIDFICDSCKVRNNPMEQRWDHANIVDIQFENEIEIGLLPNSGPIPGLTLRAFISSYIVSR
jgi:hypothetical protein